jgi:hypothetical protein
MEITKQFAVIMDDKVRAQFKAICKSKNLIVGRELGRIITEYVQAHQWGDDE